MYYHDHQIEGYTNHESLIHKRETVYQMLLPGLVMPVFQTIDDEPARTSPQREGFTPLDLSPQSALGHNLGGEGGRGRREGKGIRKKKKGGRGYMTAVARFIGFRPLFRNQLNENRISLEITFNQSSSWRGDHEKRTSMKSI